MKNRLPFPILYEDRWVIVINKPAGLLTTHTRAKEINTAEAWLNDYVRKGQLKSRKCVYLVHRLDRETSGVMMFAKDEATQSYFREHWSELTEKIYLARVEGTMPTASGVFESELKEDDDGYKVRSVSSGGKLARTEWKVLSGNLVEVRLKSGRKNQIRVHFSEAGHPIVGDVKYGGQKAKRMFLDAKKLRFKLPNGEWKEVEHDCDFL